MSKKAPTHDDAWKALTDPDVPVRDALKIFERAYRRSNSFTKGFVLHMSGIARGHRPHPHPPAEE
jgi:hypothetical protein